MKIMLYGVYVATTMLMFQSEATANFAGPTPIKLSRSSVAPGETVRIKGNGFATCNDVGRGPQQSPPVRLPLSNIKILLVQGKQSIPIGQVDANKNFSISVTVTIPADAAPGRGFIEAEIPGYAKNQSVFSVTRPKKVPAK